MIFVSKYAAARFTIAPDDYEYHGHRRVLVRGLHAQFVDNRFDTEQAQRTEKWSDEQRKQVEEGLLASEDLNRTLSLIDPNFEIGPQIMPEVLTCLFDVTVDGNVESCGRPAISEDGYCQKHAAMIEVAPKTRKKEAAHA